jgi:hypothetical protein
VEYFEFATVSYCTNVPKGMYLSDDEAQSVAMKIQDAFELALHKSPFSKEISVSCAEYGMGCVITTLTLCATLAALHKFVKDYPKFRPGLILLLKDLNGMYVWIKGNEPEGSTYHMNDDIPDQEKLQDIAKDAKSGKGKPAKSPGKPTRRSTKDKP